ncbi:VWA domain-containing protein [Sneathiella sp. CAU 1612]|uniref:VWA domain-containing protein n=1 Tax=Sneathiella sedimenti TaxID=2816034 RepID=A0ABS3F5I7_9PROT|nr:VWA domain-containing protein [Sneathiella sedimenti]MBO0333768.1 VWA domain-containing protein [Sneathiella sedimenti]
MDKALADFVEMLRYSDVPVSISESVDAAETVRLFGYKDRGLLKTALAQVMAKTIEEQESFERCFDEFFSYQINPDLDPENTQEEAENPETSQTAESSPPPTAANDDEGQPSPASGGGEGGGGFSGEQSQGGATAPLIDLLERNDRTELTMAMTAAANAANLRNIVLMTQRGLYTRRIMEGMGLDQVNREISRRNQEGDAAGADRLSGRTELLFDAVRDMVERQLALTSSGKAKQFRQDILKNVRLSNVEHRDFKYMRLLVQRMAKRLTDMNSRVKKVKNRGHLDIRKTMRRNVAYDGILFETHWKQKHKDRPKVLAVCDVSGSVASVARFLLLFLYSLNEVLPKVRSFAFSGDLGEITAEFDRLGPEEAIPYAIDKYGGRSTDYGRALEDFKDLCLNDIDNRTTVIFLGDGRSNGADPRVDILKEIKLRAKRVIWLNPERKSIWGSGDSEMLRIAPYCTTAQTCNSLNKLELILRDLLKSN